MTNEERFDRERHLKEYEHVSEQSELPVCDKPSSNYEAMLDMGVLDALDEEVDRVKSESLNKIEDKD